MGRIKQLFKDRTRIREYRKYYCTRWCINPTPSDFPACTFFFIPTIVYNTVPYRRFGDAIFNVYFLHWYIGIGEVCLKGDNK